LSGAIVPLPLVRPAVPVRGPLRCALRAVSPDPAALH